jgi:hypothetical protein
MMAPGNIIRRLDAATGATINDSAPILSDANAQPRLATDAAGRVYLSNGSFANGRFYCFNADLTDRWSVPVPNINIGAPALGASGTLIVAGVGTNVTAYRETICYPDCNADGALTVADFGCFQARFVAGDPYGDCNADGVFTVGDFGCFQTRFLAGCP